MDQKAGAQPLLEEAQQVERIGEKQARIGNCETAVHFGIALLEGLASAQEALQERFGFELRRLQLGQEYPCQIADGSGLPEILLHENLDAAPSGTVGVAHALGHRDLHVEGQLFIRASTDQVQMTAHRPEKALGLGKGVEFVRREKPERHQLADILDPVQIFGDPEQGLQIAQAALALLDVGFDHIALALLLMPRVAFFELGLGKGAFRAFEDIILESEVERFGERCLAREEPIFQQRRANCEIGLSQPQGVTDRTAGMSHLEPQIPQDVEHAFDHALRPGCDLVGREKEQVHVREGGHFASPVASHRNHGNPFSLGRVGQRMHRLCYKRKRRQNHAIRQKAISAGRSSCLEWARGKGCGNGRAAICDCLRQDRHG